MIPQFEVSLENIIDESRGAFMTSVPGVNVIKHFSLTSPTKGNNKLECLYLEILPALSNICK